MDILTVFLAGILVGHWILLFAIWRAVIKLINILHSLEVDTVQNNESNNTSPVRLLEDGRSQSKNRYDW
jgi:hypothetical protein